MYSQRPGNLRAAELRWALAAVFLNFPALCGKVPDPQHDLKGQSLEAVAPLLRMVPNTALCRLGHGWFRAWIILSWGNDPKPSPLRQALVLNPEGGTARLALGDALEEEGNNSLRLDNGTGVWSWG
jgi:hypothetical protein